ncbi:hypothetical protein I2I05_20980 [Hymenobacter sp. BT683]|uniref:Integral membrane protein n=1 Tax=Hymenobacter jeongseonensis TaxID=2791027 RepID=A0ABS0IND1_9BACT|nr:hypothetical protein [Hymenobacter jeongseonensis]MBF9239879.1 hypothetical protein [Hymenobacter jeongseonensis]
MQESIAAVVIVLLVVTGINIAYRKRSPMSPVGPHIKALPMALFQAVLIALVAGMLTHFWTFSAPGLYRLLLVIAAVMILVFGLVRGINWWHRKRYPMSPAGPRFKARRVALLAGAFVVVWLYVGLIVLYGTR